MSKPSMLSQQPYLLRAMYDWIVDSHCTPHLFVDATSSNVIVPEEYVEDGCIILNVSAQAVSNLILGNEKITFNARFGGKPVYIDVPVDAINAIYARENGEGLTFASPSQAALHEVSNLSESDVLAESDEQEAIPRPDSSKPPVLKVVK